MPCAQASSKQRAIRRGYAVIKVVNIFKKFSEANKPPDLLRKASHHISHNLRKEQAGRIKPEGEEVQAKERQRVMNANQVINRTWIFKVIKSVSLGWEVGDMRINTKLPKQ